MDVFDELDSSEDEARARTRRKTRGNRKKPARGKNPKRISLSSTLVNGPLARKRTATEKSPFATEARTIVSSSDDEEDLPLSLMVKGENVSAAEGKKESLPASKEETPLPKKTKTKTKTKKKKKKKKESPTPTPPPPPAKKQNDESPPEKKKEDSPPEKKEPPLEEESVPEKVLLLKKRTRKTPVPTKDKNDPRTMFHYPPKKVFKISLMVRNKAKDEPISVNLPVYTFFRSRAQNTSKNNGPRVCIMDIGFLVTDLRDLLHMSSRSVKRCEDSAILRSSGWNARAVYYLRGAGKRARAMPIDSIPLIYTEVRRHIVRPSSLHGMLLYIDRQLIQVMKDMSTGNSDTFLESRQDAIFSELKGVPRIGFEADVMHHRTQLVDKRTKKIVQNSAETYTSIQAGAEELTTIVRDLRREIMTAKDEAIKIRIKVERVRQEERLATSRLNAVIRLHKRRTMLVKPDDGIMNPPKRARIDDGLPEVEEVQEAPTDEQTVAPSIDYDSSEELV